MALAPREHIIYLDLASPYAETIEVTQYDKGSNLLKLILTDNGEGYDLTGLDVKIGGTQPSGEQIFSDADSWSDNIVYYTMSDWDTSEHGQIKLEVKIYDGENNLLKNSPTFIVYCSKGALNEDQIIKSPGFSALTNAINNVNSSIERSEKLNDELTDLQGELEVLQDDLTVLKDETIISKNETIEATQNANTAISEMNSLHESVALAEELRTDAESERIKNENLRLINESDRKTNEVNRQTAEVGRNENESERISSEKNRNDVELIRIENENQRIATELERKTAENTRLSADSIRSENENERITNEFFRQANTATSIENANKAADRANIAAESCEGIIEGTGLIPSNEKGIPNGVATLDEHGKLSASQSPFSVMTFTTTISATWTGENAPYTQDIVVTGIFATDNPIVDIILSSSLTAAQIEEKAWSCVSTIIANDNKITVICNKRKPMTEIQIQLKVVR